MKERITARFGIEDLKGAAAILRAGGLVAFPTETVYGLGANALDAEAVARIFAAKERPGWDPVIVHVAGRNMVDRVASVSGEAERLMEAFWPGPLTLLLPRTASVPDNVTAGREFVGVRMPDHALALELIRLAGVPVAAPSANRFGRTSPTTAEHVLLDLDGRIDAILDGGPTTVGVESTVLDVAARVVYRPGAISVEQLSVILDCEVRVFHGPLHAAPASLPSPGVGMRHYAPRAQLLLVEQSEGLVNLLCRMDNRVQHPIGVMLPTGWEKPEGVVSFDWGPWGDLPILARRMFAGLRELDRAGVASILCPVPAGGGLGEALRDRLHKAARPRDPS